MKYDFTNIYQRAYKILENVTPLPYDCGKLCKGACCKDNDVGTGMYLYPCEIKMYKNLPEWAEIEKSDFVYGGKAAHILSCNEHCDRKMRPLACRIFPLVPYDDGEGIKIIMDPRAMDMCPVARGMKVSPEFINAVTRAMNMLKKTKEGKEFIREQSRIIDDYINIL